MRSGDPDPLPDKILDAFRFLFLLTATLDSMPLEAYKGIIVRKRGGGGESTLVLNFWF